MSEPRRGKRVRFFSSIAGESNSDANNSLPQLSNAAGPSQPHQRMPRTATVNNNAGGNEGGGIAVENQNPREIEMEVEAVEPIVRDQPTQVVYWSSAVLKALREIKHVLRDNFNNLDLNETEENIDSKILGPILETEQLTNHPAFWYALLGAVVTQLSEAGANYFEVIANWLHYATVETINQQGSDPMPIEPLREFLSFIVAAVKMADEKVKRYTQTNTANNPGPLVLQFPVELVGTIPFRMTNLNEILCPAEEQRSLIVTYPVEDDQKNRITQTSHRKSTVNLAPIELVNFSAPLKSLESSMTFAQRGALNIENIQILKQSAMLYRRNTTLALSVAVSLVESSEQTEQLLSNGVLIDFLLENLSKIIEKLPFSESAINSIPIDHLNAAILSVVTLFRAFSDLKAVHGDSENLSWEDKLPWSRAQMITEILDTLVESGGSNSNTTAAANTFAIFDHKKYRWNVCGPKKRLLLLLQCLSESFCRQLGFSEEIGQRDSAFNVPLPLPTKGDDENSEPQLAQPPLSIGYFAYSTDDVKYQPYQWKCPFPLDVPVTGEPTKRYYAEVLLFTSGHMNLGFYFDAQDAVVKDVESASDISNIVETESAVAHRSTDKPIPLAESLLSAPASPAPAPFAIFYSPTTSELLVNGHNLLTNIKTKLEEDKSTSETEHFSNSKHCIVIGVLLEKGLSESPGSSSSPPTAAIFTGPSTSAAAFADVAKNSPCNPTVYLPFYKAAVTFFVNHVKVEASSKADLDKILKTAEAPQNNGSDFVMQKFLNKFSGNLAGFKRGSSKMEAVFTLGLSGYQAVALHRPRDSWQYQKESLAVYNTGNWEEFPVMAEHAAIERHEMRRVYNFKMVADIDKPLFQAMFRSEKASYKLKKVLGSGSYGKVLKCIPKFSNVSEMGPEEILCEQKAHSKTNFVAVKVMEVRSLIDLKSIKREEAFHNTITQNDNCPTQFIKLLDAFTFDSVYTCHVFEFVETNLFDFSRKNRLTILKTKSIFHQLLRALEFLNTMKYIHGDIKPANVMVKTDDENEVSIKLIDFGFAWCYDKHKVGKEIVTYKGQKPFDMNKFDNTLMTPGFASPELLLQMQNQTLSDLWQVGVTIVEAIKACNLYSDSSNENVYPQLAAIWKFCEDCLPESSFYDKLKDDIKKQFFVNEFKAMLGSSNTKIRCAKFWRIKTPSEMTGENPTLPGEQNENSSLLQGRWIIKKVEEVRTKETITEINQPVLEDLHDLLRQIFKIDPAKRISVENALKHNFFTF